MLSLFESQRIKHHLLNIYRSFNETLEVDYLDLKVFYLTTFHKQVASLLLQHHKVPQVYLKPSPDFSTFFKKFEVLAKDPLLALEMKQPLFCEETEVSSKEAYFNSAFTEVCQFIPEFEEVFFLLVSAVCLKNFQYMTSASEAQFPGYMLFCYNEATYPNRKLQLDIIHEVLHQVLMLAECNNNFFTFTDEHYGLTGEAALTGSNRDIRSVFHSLFVGLALVEYRLVSNKLLDEIDEALLRLKASFDRVDVLMASCEKPLLTKYGLAFYAQGHIKYQALQAQVESLKV